MVLMLKATRQTRNDGTALQINLVGFDSHCQPHFI